MTVRQKFKSAIKRGTGEAHLIMKDNSKVDFSSDIINAALTNLSYDNQSEGSRANYVYDLIELSNQKGKIKDAVLKGLATERKDSWALDQLFEITALFAKQGDKEAKKEIYKRFHKKIIKGSEWVGQDAIIEVDGLNGLKYVAETKGKIDPDGWEDSITVESFQEKNPAIKVYDELKKLAKDSPNIKTFLDTILKYKNSKPKWERTKSNYEIVTERIHSKAIVPLPPAGAKDLTKLDIKKLADDFLKETNRLRKEKYMRVFDRVKFPYDYKPILDVAKGKYSGKDRLIEYAVNALRYFNGKNIRNFALAQIPKATRPDIYTNLLIANYKNGDSKLLQALIDQTNNEHKIHALVFSYVEIYRKNRTKDCKAPLVALYDKLTCGLHRADIVKIMIENGVLPARIKAEIKFDSYDEIRKLYA